MKRASVIGIVLSLVLTQTHVFGQAEQAEKTPAAKQKKRAAKSKADDAPQWVWANPQAPAGTTHKTFRSATLKGQEVSYLIVVGDQDTGRGNTYEWNVKLRETLDGLGIQNELCVVPGVRHSYQLLAADERASQKHLAYYAAVFQK
jgi:hypothetical protein